MTLSGLADTRMSLHQGASDAHIAHVHPFVAALALVVLKAKPETLSIPG